MDKINVAKEINELKNQLAYSKNIGFFFGAGTSCALGIPDVNKLTEKLEEKLDGSKKDNFKSIKDELNTIHDGKNINIEHILNYARQVKELTHGEPSKEYQGLDGKSAKELDVEICKNINQIISAKEEKADLQIPTKLFAWLNQLNRDFTKEVFTTNYDFIFEKSLENLRTPYFDGFLGANEPFFYYESIDNKSSYELPPKSWIRLWKMHGSLNWYWADDPDSSRIIRTNGSMKSSEQGIVIYPSRKKYDLSRKQPFVAYFDRLKDYLQSNQLLFIFSGYSFSDEHINEIVFNSLRQNNRLFCVIFFYRDEEVENFLEIAPPHLNLNVFGPTKGIIKGSIGDFKLEKEDVETTYFWNKEEEYLLLGDFKKLATFLIKNSGKSEENLFKSQ